MPSGTFWGGFASTYDPYAVGNAVGNAYRDSKQESAHAEADKQFEEGMARLNANAEGAKRDVAEAAKGVNQQMVDAQADVPIQIDPSPNSDEASHTTYASNGVPIVDRNIRSTQRLAPVRTAPRTTYASNGVPIVDMNTTDDGPAVQPAINPYMGRDSKEYQAEVRKLQIAKRDAYRKADLERETDYRVRKQMQEKWTAEDEDENFRAGQRDFYEGVMNGDPQHLRTLANFANTFMGTQIQVGEDGRLMAPGKDGKLVAFAPDRQVLREATERYLAAQSYFRKGGDSTETYLKNVHGINADRRGDEQLQLNRDAGARDERRLQLSAQNQAFTQRLAINADQRATAGQLFDPTGTGGRAGTGGGGASGGGTRSITFGTTVEGDSGPETPITLTVPGAKGIPVATSFVLKDGVSAVRPANMSATKYAEVIHGQDKKYGAGNYRIGTYFNPTTNTTDLGVTATSDPSRTIMLSTDSAVPAQQAAMFEVTTGGIPYFEWLAASGGSSGGSGQVVPKGALYPDDIKEQLLRNSGLRPTAQPQALPMSGRPAPQRGTVPNPAPARTSSGAPATSAPKPQVRPQQQEAYGSPRYFSPATNGSSVLYADSGSGNQRDYGLLDGQWDRDPLKGYGTIGAGTAEENMSKDGVTSNGARPDIAGGQDNAAPINVVQEKESQQERKGLLRRFGEWMTEPHGPEVKLPGADKDIYGDSKPFSETRFGQTRVGKAITEGVEAFENSRKEFARHARENPSKGDFEALGIEYSNEPAGGLLKAAVDVGKHGAKAIMDSREENARHARENPSKGDSEELGIEYSGEPTGGLAQKAIDLAKRGGKAFMEAREENAKRAAKEPTPPGFEETGVTDKGPATGGLAQKAIDLAKRGGKAFMEAREENAKRAAKEPTPPGFEETGVTDKGPATGGLAQKAIDLAKRGAKWMTESHGPEVKLPGADKDIYGTSKPFSETRAGRLIRDIQKKGENTDVPERPDEIAKAKAIEVDSKREGPLTRAYKKESALRARVEEAQKRGGPGPEPDPNWEPASVRDAKALIKWMTSPHGPEVKLPGADKDIYGDSKPFSETRAGKELKEIGTTISSTVRDLQKRGELTDVPEDAVELANAIAAVYVVANQNPGSKVGTLLDLGKTVIGGRRKAIPADADPDADATLFSGKAPRGGTLVEAAARGGKALLGTFGYAATQYAKSATGAAKDLGEAVGGTAKDGLVAADKGIRAHKATLRRNEQMEVPERQDETAKAKVEALDFRRVMEERKRLAEWMNGLPDGHTTNGEYRHSASTGKAPAAFEATPLGTLLHSQDKTKRAMALTAVTLLRAADDKTREAAARVLHAVSEEAAAAGGRARARVEQGRKSAQRVVDYQTGRINAAGERVSSAGRDFANAITDPRRERAPADADAAIDAALYADKPPEGGSLAEAAARGIEGARGLRARMEEVQSRPEGERKQAINLEEGRFARRNRYYRDAKKTIKE